MKLGAAGAAFAAATSAVAEEHSLELGARGQRVDIANVETDVVGIDATYYFPPIDDARGPYSLAPFLSRSSRVTVAVHRDVETTTITSSSPFTGPSTIVLDTETEGGSIFGRYVLRPSGWYAGGNYQVSGGGPPPSTLTRTDVDVDGYGLHVGKYLSASTSLEIGWDSTESTIESIFSGCISYPICQPLGGTHISEITAEEASVRVFHVGDVGRLSYSVSGRAASRRTDRRILLLDPVQDFVLPFGPPAAIGTLPERPNVAIVSNPPVFGVGPVAGGINPVPNPPPIGRIQTYSAAGAVFPTARLSVGVGYSRWDGDRALDDAYDVSVGWFFLRNAAARVRFSRTNRTIAIDALNEVDDISLRLTGRF